MKQLLVIGITAIGISLLNHRVGYTPSPAAPVAKQQLSIVREYLKAVKAKYGNFNSLTTDEVKILKEFYPVRKNSEVLAMLLPGRTERQMYNKVQLMGIHKDKAFWGQYMRDLYNDLSEEQLEQRRKSQFKKGHSTHNKGVPMPEHVREKLKHTWYQKGHQPKHALYDGAITIRNDKEWGQIRFIRVDKGRWIPLHHYVWQQAGNEVKEGHVIIFIDGDTSNCAIDNLQQITCADNMRRNSIVNYGKEFQSLCLTIASFKRRLKKYRQHSKQQ